MQFPEPTRRRESKHYCFYYLDPKTNRRNKKSTGKTTKREAKAFISEFMNNLNKGLTEKTFREYAEPFFVLETCPHCKRKQYENKNIGVKHIRNTRSWLVQHVFADLVFSNLKISDIRRGHILALRDRIRKNVSDSVLNKTMNAVKVIFTEAYYHEDIDRNPGSEIGALQYEKREKDILEIKEIKKLFTERPGYWGTNLCYDVFFIVAQTGLRRGEILALGKDQIDLTNRILNINRAWKLRDVMGRLKWEKSREIPVSQKVIDILMPYLEKTDDLIFSYDDGSRIGDTWWQKNFILAMGNAKIDLKKRNVTPHSLRHSLNTHLISEGCDVILTQAYLGWASKLAYLTKVQNGYTHLAAIQLQGVVDKIDQIYNDISPLKIVREVLG